MTGVTARVGARIILHSVTKSRAGNSRKIAYMSQIDTDIANLRVDSKQHHLDDVLADFRGGQPSDPAEYQRAVNDLCKTLLALDDTGHAAF